MHSITSKKDAFFFITTTEEIAQDIKQLCCGANASVLGVDTTFNLCNMWVTRNRKYNPNLLVHTLFYFTKDDKTFSRLGHLNFLTRTQN